MTPLFLADFSLFVGRFHPLIVHLPIGILLLAAIMEFWPGERVRPAIRVAWGLGALGAIAAAICGWLLAEESGGGDTLFWHRWLGVSVAVLATIGVYVGGKGGKLAKGYGILVVALLGLAGHQGGNLTHGEEYLFQHAPPVVQRLAGHAPDSTDLHDWTGVPMDSINLYATFLQPALNDNCTRCHNADKQNGGLRMDAPHYLFAGGDGGPTVVAGSPLASSWYTRVTLPRENVKSMPPQGQPWDYANVELLRYWIAEGADTAFVLRPGDTPEDIKALLARDYGLDLRPQLFVETILAPALSAKKMETLRQMNWNLSPLVPGGSALEVKVQPGRELAPGALAQLAELAPQNVAYLSLDRLPLEDRELSVLTRFENLNRLRLNGTKVTATTVANLKKLKHLESLNLYGTDLDDGVFEHLATLPSLRRVYLWQTKVTPEAARTYAAAHPQVDVDTGFTFATPAPDNSSK